jgi:hypothetical protein
MIEFMIAEADWFDWFAFIFFNTSLVVCIFAYILGVWERDE